MARNIDWEAIEREYRANQLSVVEIGRQYGVSHTAINKRAKAYNWTRDLAKAVRQTVKAKLVSDAVSPEVSAANVRETIEFAAARAVEVVRSHRKALAQLNAISDILATRLSQHLDGVAMDGPGLGDRESPSDMLEKLSRTRQRAIQLERQAFNLDAQADDEGDGGGGSVNDRDRAKAILAALQKAKNTAE
jgi:hypothetical protein